MASAAANRYARALVDVVLAPGSPLKPERCSCAIARRRTNHRELSRIAQRPAHARHSDLPQARGDGPALQQLGVSAPRSAILFT